jgi:predicted nucleic acid-binding protein
VFREPDKAPWAEQIGRLIGGGQIVAYVPELFWAEFQHVCGRKIGEAGLSRLQVEQAYEDVVALPLREVAVLVDLRDAAWQLRLNLGVGSYDAYFLALAQDQGIEYWTFDQPLCRLVGADPAVRATVKLIGVEALP